MTKRSLSMLTVKQFSVYSMYVSVFTCLCNTCVPGVYLGQNRVSDPLELELKVVVTTMLMLEIEPGPKEEQPVFLTIEPPLQSPSF